MALQLKDRVRTACSTVGTGNIIVGSNRAGYQNWDAITNGNTVYYCIIEGNAWEVGHGVKTDGEITRNVIASSTGSLIDLKGTEDVFETYPAEKAVILDVDGNLTVDGDVFADNLYTKSETNTLLDNKANKSDTYTKSETYSSVEVDGKLFEKADKATTYTKTEVDATQDAQNTNITSNTTAIGTLSGKVATNTADIATLQEGIFFSSSYTTDYPSSPNRNPETGNIYLQNLSAFTYSYADANQVFISKTDEQGNVRQFTAVNTDDILVLNQVESPNYGRYKVSTVNDLGDYVNIIFEFQTGEGTVLEGDTLALQAFPASAGGSGDSIWTEADGVATYDGRIEVSGSGTFSGVNLGSSPDTGASVGYSPANDTTVYNGMAGHTWYLDGSTKLVLDKTGDGNGQFRIADLSSTTNSNPANVFANSAGKLFMSTATPSSGGIPEAPVDGKQYGRQDATWTEVTGGGYTPEDIVWKNVKAEREKNIVYTNDNDVPLYINVSIESASDTGYRLAELHVDGVLATTVAKGPYTATNAAQTDKRIIFYIIPVGSTYEIVTSSTQIGDWTEAKMPLAIANPSVETAIGMVAPFAMDSVPTGWLHCDGSAVSRSTYSLLYSKVGDTYGEGDGSTTFNLPDLQDEFIRGSSDTLPVGNKQDDEFKAHTHSTENPRKPTGGTVGGTSNTPAAAPSGGGRGSVTATGGDETRPRNVAMLYCINATAEATTRAVTPETATPSSFARIVDEKPQGTYGGNSIAGIQQRTLNKIEYDADNIVTLSEDLNFTLQAGTYVIDFKAPASSGVNYHNCYLHSVTDNVKVAQGDVAYLAADTSYSSGKYYVTLTEPHTYQIQHYTGIAITYGLGYTCQSGASIYTSVDIEKVGTGGASSGGGGTTEVYGTAKAVAKIVNSEITGTEAVPTMDGVYNGLGIKGIGKVTTGKYFIDFEDGLFEDDNYVATGLVTYPTSGTGATLLMRDDRVGTSTKNRFYFATITSAYTDAFKIDVTVFDNKPVLVSGGSGGGSYTPEKMVWEDKTNVANTVYTNTNDVPLYVQFAVYSPSGDENNLVDFKIDDVVVGAVGSVGVSNWNNPLYIVPAGSTYEVVSEQLATVDKWREAKMPVAIGSGSGGGGVIKQVKQFRKTDIFESSSALPSTTKVTGLTATITPKSTNSKIMVMVTGAVGVSANNYGTAIQLYRGAEQINLAEIRGTETNAIMGTPVNGTGWSESFSVNYLDSPNTTDEVSYELYLGAEDGATAMLGGTVSSSVPSSASVPTNIILMEVGEDSGGGSGEATGTPSSFARIVDKKAKTVAGGNSIAGTQNRDLNTIQYDADNIVTLVDNDFTLQAGTYVINYSAPANKVEAHNVSLYDYTDSQYVNTGTVNYTLDNASNTSYGNYSVTLTEPHTYAVTHTTEVAKTNGLGNLNPVNDGIFATVDIQKVGTGGSGGGSYTPEKMVWEDKLSERSANTAYTNSYDSPLQVTVYASGVGGGQSLIVYIDGNVHGRTGAQGSEQQYMTVNFTVPSGSTYSVENVDNVPLLQWYEAKMPVAIGGDSIWKDELGYAVHDGQVKATYDNSEAQVNTAEPKQTLALTNPNGDDGTGDNNYTSLGFNVADGATSKGFITYSRGGDNKGKFVFSQRTGSDTYATQMIVDGDGFVKLTRDGQEINLNPSYSDTGNAIIESNDPIGLMSGGNLGVKIIPDGRTYMYGVNDNEGAATPNVVIGPDGQMFKSTTATYSAEEVDKKLAIKDKLIEKLSARLDELEKKVK